MFRNDWTWYGGQKKCLKSLFLRRDGGNPLTKEVKVVSNKGLSFVFDLGQPSPFVHILITIVATSYIAVALV